MKGSRLHLQIQDILNWVILNTEYSTQEKIAKKIGVGLIACLVFRQLIRSPT